MLDLLLNEAWVRGALVALAVATPLAALPAGRVLRPRFAPSMARAIQGFLAAIGPVTLLLWWTYNGIMGWFGLDSVVGLSINAVLFTLVGLAGGLIWRRMIRRDGPQTPSPRLDAGSLDSE